MLARGCSTKVAEGFFGLPPAVRRSFWSTARAAARHQDPEVYDVVCIGGGPAGLGLCSALRASPQTSSLKIALIDSQCLAPKLGTGDSYSNRCSSLTPGSVRFLQDIGAWRHIDDVRTQPYHGMEVWDGVSGSRITFDLMDKAPSVLDLIPGFQATGNRNNVVATMTENSILATALLSNLDSVEPIDIFSKTKVESITLGDPPSEEQPLDFSSWPIVSLPSDRRLAARLLVGADGANSPVRAFADIPSHGWDYNRHGVVATLKLETGFSENDWRTAYQRFLPTGPVALLPLPNNFVSLVWSTTLEHATRLKSLSPEDFIAMANAAFRLLPVDLAYMHTLPSGQAAEAAWREQNTALPSSRLPPRITTLQSGSTASFPLRMRHASTYTGARVALIGDAAHTIHPLAGQGLNLGLSDARALAGCIASAVGAGADIGSSFVLDEYNAEQWGKNHMMLSAVDKLHKLYSAGSGPVVWARSLGLDLVNQLRPVKELLMRQAARAR